MKISQVFHYEYLAHLYTRIISKGSMHTSITVEQNLQSTEDGVG
jgi:hypothetical protein